MCWRDNVRQTRYCSACGREYYGDLGHRNCPKSKAPDHSSDTKPSQEEPPLFPASDDAKRVQ